MENVLLKTYPQGVLTSVRRNIHTCAPPTETRTQFFSTYYEYLVAYLKKQEMKSTSKDLKDCPHICKDIP